MMMEELFNLVKKSAKDIHDNGKADGQHFWGGIKKIVEKHDEEEFVWKKKNMNKKRKDEIMNTLPEYETFGNEERRIIEENHFVIQTVRIPLKEPCTIRKLTQIALNIGQYEALQTGRYKLNSDEKSMKAYVTKPVADQMSKVVTRELLEKVKHHVLAYMHK